MGRQCKIFFRIFCLFENCINYIIFDTERFNHIEAHEIFFEKYLVFWADSRPGRRGPRVCDGARRDKQCRTNFPLAFLNAMQHYQDTHEKILGALNDASGALVSSLKKRDGFLT